MTPTAAARYNPNGFTLAGSLVLDRYHLYEGETIGMEVRVCNTNPDAPVVYMIEYVDALGLWVSGRNGTVTGAGGDVNYTPRRYEEVPAGDCLSLAFTWDGANPSYETRAKAGIYEVRGDFAGHDPDAKPGEIPYITIDSVFIEVHDGPRPAGAEPPPPTGFPGPEWSLHVRTDAEEYRVGDEVAITVEWCNETDTPQEYTDRDSSDYEFELEIFLRRGNGDLETVAWLQPPPVGAGTAEVYTLAPGACDSGTITWRGTRDEFKGDGTSAGEPAPAGSYLLRAYKYPGPSGAYTNSLQADASMSLTAT